MINIKKEFVTYEQAFALKELEFNKPCFAYFCEDIGYQMQYKNPMFSEDFNSRRGTYLNDISAPTYSQALRWFREKYSLKHDIEDDSKGEKFYYKIKSFDDKKFDNYYDVVLFLQKRKDWSEIEFDSYEEAESACLDKLIEIVKRKENEKI